MIVSQFPDLQWLKSQIDHGFSDRRGPGNLALGTDGFPSVVINAKAKAVYRPDIMGPISVFMNLQGQSRCKVDGRTVMVDEDAYFITNRFQPYTLEIEHPPVTETFNIHIGEYFSEQLLASVMHSSDTLLNEGKQLTVPTVAFHNQLYRRNKAFNMLVRSLRNSREEGSENIRFEENLAGFFIHLLQQHRNVLATIESMPPLKASTKRELYKRLSMATDHIHASYMGPLELDEIANTACLSKFHFLRLFKHVYHVSPYQYLQQLRLGRSQQLLKNTLMPVSEIAMALGYENSNSFSRIFMQRMGVYPSQYRAVVN